MKKTTLLLVPPAVIVLSGALLFNGTVNAAGLGQRSSDLEEVVVTADASSALSARSATEAIRELRRIPGGIGLVRAEDYLVEFTQSIGDALEFTPGVFADTSAQRENRISIRGSGANATFERRGITVLRDGVPISRASGITEYQEIDPLSIDYIEVYKGSNGLRYGAASLGGAINVVTPTGATSAPGTSIRLEGGSFDTYRASINTKGKSGDVDYYGAVTKLNSNGFREHAEVDSIYSFGNVGFKLSDSVETRFYLTALQDDFELAGSLTLEQALNNPEMSPLENSERDHDRNLDVYRLSNRTVFQLDFATVETGFWVASRDLDHAITRFVGIIDQSETEYGLSTELSGNLELFESPTTWVFGASVAESTNEAKVFDYLGGPFAPSTPAKGVLTSEDEQDARNTIVYGQLDFALTDSLTVVTSAQYVKSTRKNENIFNDGGEDDTGKLNFENLSGRLGFLYSLNADAQLYVNVSEGYEPPGISDLTSGGADPFTVLEAQESLTYEVGTRGRQGIVSWDIAVYRSKVNNEFIDEAPQFGGPSNTNNAESDTRHQGLELGLDISLLDNLLWRNIYTYSDFNFKNDPLYGNNAIAGIPESVYVTELKYGNADDWYAAINLRHIANGAYADFANNVQAPGYQLIGLNAGMTINDSYKLFASIENITDEEFVSNVSTTHSASDTSTVFTPGEGRTAYVGISIDL